LQSVVKIDVSVGEDDDLSGQALIGKPESVCECHAMFDHVGSDLGMLLVHKLFRLLALVKDVNVVNGTAGQLSLKAVVKLGPACPME
jgi:hypothetical protein